MNLNDSSYPELTSPMDTFIVSLIHIITLHYFVKTEVITKAPTAQGPKLICSGEKQHIFSSCKKYDTHRSAGKTLNFISRSYSSVLVQGS